MSIIHLGIKLIEKRSNHINKDFYLTAKPEGMIGWVESSYPIQRIKADINFDSNMKYFNSLDPKDFNKNLNKLIKKYKLKECKDLTKLEGKSGIYVIVLDEYRQVYIGVTSNIKTRIHNGHWNKHKSLERLIFGDLFTSKLSIDSFGALDTTRIYYRDSRDDLYLLEEQMVESLDCCYLLNRTKGGIGSIETYTEDELSAKLAVTANRKKINLIPFTNLERLSELPEKTLEFYMNRYPELKNLISHTK